MTLTRFTASIAGRNSKLKVQALASIVLLETTVGERRQAEACPLNLFDHGEHVTGSDGSTFLDPDPFDDA